MGQSAARDCGASVDGSWVVRAGAVGKPTDGMICWGCWISSPAIAELTQAIEREVENYPAAQRLRTHPGVGVLTALAFVLILGDAERFHCGKQVASYLGLVPLEDSSGNRRRLGHITKQGSSIVRFLLVEVAVAVRSLPE